METIMSQQEFLKIVCLGNPTAMIIGSIGTISYDLAGIPHDRQKILVKGAMGAVLGVGFGYALARPDKQVVVFIGEGSLLMQLGSISTILKHDLPNLKIIVINNGCYNSCGGQKNNFDAIRHLIKPHFGVFDAIPVSNEFHPVGYPQYLTK